MGTPEFAVPPIRALAGAGHEICAVFTKPDRPRDRGMKLTASPVKLYALENKITVYQPETLKDNAVLPILQGLSPDIIVVAAYGKLLPPYVLEFPRFGCVNIHASLLPKYRGAGPIQRAVINGEEETGVTTMYMAEGMDTGDIIDMLPLKIGTEETAGELHDRLMAAGAELIVKTIEKIENGAAVRTPQNEAEATYAPMLLKSDARIDWNKSAREIINLVRGTNPWPVAFTALFGEPLKLFRASAVNEPTAFLPGTVTACGKDGVHVACGGGESLVIRELQAAGGKKMSAPEFIKGHPIPDETILGE